MKKSKFLSTLLMLSVVFALVMPLALLFSACNKQPNTKGHIIYVVGEIQAKSVEYDNGTTLTQEQVYENWQETRPGYQFDGWYFDSAKTRKVEGDLTVNGNITLYATSVLASFTITFDTDGGTPIASITKAYNETITLVNNPTKEGYDFVGWTPALPEKMPAQNLTLTANWQVHSHTITFVWGDEDDEQLVLTQNYGTELVAPVPTKEGYTLTGWGADVPATVPDQDLLFRAAWQINSHTISFDSDGGTIVSPITQDYGTTVVAPNAPTKEGYTFAGWFEDGASTQFVFSTMPDRDVELVARWVEHGFTMTFVLNNGEDDFLLIQSAGTEFVAPTPERTGYKLTGWTPALPDTFPAENRTFSANWKAHDYSLKRVFANGADETTTYTIEDTFSLGSPTREGYTFDYWVVSSANGNWVADAHIEATTSLSQKYGDVVVTAVDHINSHTITFDTVGGTSIAPITQNYGTEIIAPANPTKEGYTFVSWSRPIPSTMPDEDITITAQWQLNSYHINVAIQDNPIENWNDAIAEKIAYYQNLLENPELTENDEYQIRGLIAVLQNAAKTYGYSFFANNLDFGDNDTAICDSYKDELMGTDNAVRDAIIAAGANADSFVTFGANQTTAIDVSYNTNVASMYLVFASVFYQPQSLTISIGEETIVVNLLQMTDTHLVRVERMENFAAASVIRLNLDIANMIDDGRYIYDGDMSISVSWKKLSAQVTYNPGSLGTEIEGETFSETFNFDSGYTLAVPDFGAVGYHVVSWHNPDDPSDVVYSLNAAITAAKALDMFLFNGSFEAVWEADQNPFVFNANDSDDTRYQAVMPEYNVTATYNQSLSALANLPTREGYTFLGFFTSNNVKIFNANGTVNVPAENNTYLSTTGTWKYWGENQETITLYAHWQGNPYTITFNANGGIFTNLEETYVSEFACGAVVTVPDNPSRSGWKFNGWNMTIPTKMPANNLTITALWKTFHVTVSIEEGFEEAGTITTLDQDVAANSLVELSVLSVADAYQFAGWYEGASLLGTETTLTFTMAFADRNIVARFTVKPELANFEFNTTDGFVITGIKESVDKSKITSIVVPSYVTEIAEGAFKGCPNLVSLDIPFIGRYGDTTRLGTYEGMWMFPFKVTADEYTAVNNKSTVYMKVDFTTSGVAYQYLLPYTLVNLYLHATYGVDEHNDPKPLSIASNAFCKDTTISNAKTTITTIYFDGTLEDWLNVSLGNQSSNPMFPATTTNLFLKNDQNEYVSTAGTLYLPTTITEVSPNKFIGWSQITTLFIPSNIRRIGNYSFKGCTGLDKVIIEAGAFSYSDTIVSTAFTNCEITIGVFIYGTETDWTAMSSKIKSTVITNATRYFYSETAPDSSAYDEGTGLSIYWHYVDNEPVIWTKPTQS